MRTDKAETERLFHGALEVPRSQREAWLRSRCGGDEQLLREVTSLLAADEDPDLTKIDVSVDPRFAASAMNAAVPQDLPLTIGPYSIAACLGSGGFGVVYLGERSDPVTQRVAIKVLKAGVGSVDTVRRFQRERETVAAMDHPGIARLIDAGQTDDGRPYFVMEHVPGLPINQYCDRHRLDLRARLRLFEQACTAVQHAHAKGVVHRDLKPGNILVADGHAEVSSSNDGGGPRVKIIDFGIARLLNVTGIAAESTIHGQILGTIEYMSPEQASLATDIDTRSDIYSLGVVLYELLVGEPPVTSRLLRKGAFEEMLRLVRETEAPRPSLRAATLMSSATGSDGAPRTSGTAFADARSTDVRSLVRQLRDELEWIPLRAMRRVREERYQTVAEFAADLRNYLQGLPLAAGPDTSWYRASKFVRRHRAGIAGLAILFLTLIGGVVGTSIGMRRASVAALEAKAAAAATLEENYVGNLAAAEAAMQLGDSLGARRRLDACPQGLRGWEWHVLSHATDQTSAVVTVSNGEGTISDVSMTPASPYAAVVADGRVILLDKATWKRVKGTPVDGAAVSARHVSGGRLAVLGRSGRIELRAVPSLQILSQIDVPREFVSLAVSPGQDRIAAVSSTDVWLFHVAGDSIASHREVPTSGATGAAFNPDGGMVAVAGNRKSVTAYSWSDGRAVMEYATEQYGHAVAFSPDGRWIAHGGTSGEILVWDAHTGGIRIQLHSRGSVERLAFSTDGKELLAVGADPCVRVWDTKKWRSAPHIMGQPSGGTVVAIDGEDVIAVGCHDGRLRAFSRTGGLGTRRISSPSLGRLCLDGVTLIEGKEYLRVRQELKSQVTLIDAESLQPAPLSIDLGRPARGSVSIGSDSAIFAVDDYGQFTRWEPSAGTKQALFQTSPQFIAFRTCFFHVAADESFACIPHDTFRWSIIPIKPDAPACTIASGFHILGVLSSGEILAWREDGRICAARCSRQGGFTVQRVFDDACARPWKFAISSDGTMLATGGDEPVIVLWDPRSGRKVKELTERGHHIQSLHFLDGGTRLASVGTDGHLRVWHVPKSRLLVEIALGTTWPEAVLGIGGDALYVSTGSSVHAWRPRREPVMNVDAVEVEDRAGDSDAP